MGAEHVALPPQLEVILGKALVTDPRVLVLDDPLSALDVHTEAEVEAFLKTLREVRSQMGYAE